MSEFTDTAEEADENQTIDDAENGDDDADEEEDDQQEENGADSSSKRSSSTSLPRGVFRIAVKREADERMKAHAYPHAFTRTVLPFSKLENAKGIIDLVTSAVSL